LQAPATDYGAESVEGYEHIVEELGLESVYAGRHKGSETEFVGTATSIKNSGCELLFLGSFIKDTILLYTAVGDAGWKGTVVANMVPCLPEIPAAADGGMNGMYAVAPFYVPDFSIVEPNAWVGRWQESYEERFGIEPAAQAVIGYLCADLTAIALERAGSDQARCDQLPQPVPGPGPAVGNGCRESTVLGRRLSAARETSDGILRAGRYTRT
jgi:branched-chain amino acid transport system substrate-binding protein